MTIRIRKSSVFNLVWGTIIGVAIGTSSRLLMEDADYGSVSGIAAVGVGGSVAMGCLAGLLDPSFGIIASYFGAFFSLVIYVLIKNPESSEDANRRAAGNSFGG